MDIVLDKVVRDFNQNSYSICINEFKFHFKSNFDCSFIGYGFIVLLSLSKKIERKVFFGKKNDMVKNLRR